MSSSFHISPANPIRFLPHHQPLSKWRGRDGRYVQKYCPTDYTSLQVCGDDGGMSFHLDIVDRYGNQVRSYSPVHSMLGEYDEFHFWTFDVGFSGLDGCCRLVLTVNGADKYESNPLWISQKHGDLTLLQYRNSLNKDSINYAAVDMFSLRVEGGFQMKNYVPKSDDTVYRNVDMRFEVLHSDTWYTRMFTAGGTRGIPDELHYIVHKAFGCDTVYINGDGYVKYEGADWEEKDVDHYPLRTWMIEVVGTGYRYVREAEPPLPPEPPEPPTVTYKWTNYVCRKPNGVYTGYAAAMTLEVYHDAILSAPYLITQFNFPGFSPIDYTEYAALSLPDLHKRVIAFLSEVEYHQKVAYGVELNISRATTKIPVSLVNVDDSLTNDGKNLITSARAVEGVVIESVECGWSKPEPSLTVTPSTLWLTPSNNNQATFDIITNLEWTIE